VGRPKGSKNQRKTKVITDTSYPVSSPELNEEKVNKLAMCLSNPREVRSDQELAIDLDIQLKDIRKLKADPQFIEPVNQAFRRHLQSIGPEIIRRVFRQAMEGSSPSQKLLLEASGWISGPGGKTVVNVGGVSVQKDDISNMSDVDLDREIHRLMMETYPEDCILSEGKVVPIDSSSVEVLDVGSYDVGGNDGENQEREIVQASTGEAEEDGR
jgi:hypothetical protein